MASVNIILKQRNKDKNKEGILYLQLIKSRGDKTEVSLRRKVLPIHWDKVKQKVKKGHNGYSPLNIFLNNEKNVYNTLINLKEARNEFYSVKELVAARKRMTSGAPKTKDLYSYLKYYIDENPQDHKHNTLHTYRSTLASLKEFNSPTEYTKVDSEWIKRFKKFLGKKGNKINTISHRMKVLIKIFNILLEEGKISKNPFDGYKRKNEKSKREFLTPDELEKFENYEAKSNSQILLKDIFLFSCYTGLRFSDLSLLTTSNIKKMTNGQFRLDIKTEKNESLLDFRITKKASVIYKKYKIQKNEKYLFPIIDIKKVFSRLKATEEFSTLNVMKDLAVLDNRKNLVVEKAIKIAISNRLAYFNPLLKKIVQKAEIDKHITFHSSRHTFATLALDLEVPVHVLQDLLGHQNLKETMIYSNILGKQRDAASDKLDKM